MHQQCVIWVLPLVFFDSVAAFPRESGTPQALFPCRVAIAGLKSRVFCAKWNIPLPPLRGAEPEAPQVLHPALCRESVVRTWSRGPQGLGTLSEGGCSHCRQGALATFVCKSIPHCSRGAGEQLSSSLRMMAQLPCTCSFQQTRRLGGGLPFCTVNVRATSLITQHCHFKQPISWGKNLIISGESSSLFGWENVGGGGGRPGTQTRQKGMGRAAAWHRQGSGPGAGGQHRIVGSGGAGGTGGAWGCPRGMLWLRKTCNPTPERLRLVGEMQPMLPGAWRAAHTAGKASEGEKRICKGSEPLGRELEESTLAAPGRRWGSHGPVLRWGERESASFRGPVQTESKSMGGRRALKEKKNPSALSSNTAPLALIDPAGN